MGPVPCVQPVGGEWEMQLLSSQVGNVLFSGCGGVDRMVEVWIGCSRCGLDNGGLDWMAEVWIGWWRCGFVDC